MRVVTLTIKGMHCDGCAQTIKAFLGTEPGVHVADVSYKTGEARVLYDPLATEADRLVEAIEKIGYKVPGRGP